MNYIDIGINEDLAVPQADYIALLGEARERQSLAAVHFRREGARAVDLARDVTTMAHQRDRFLGSSSGSSTS